ncbi:MAG: hypothetical protein K1X78_04095 [Verrucomicrobiaceae bacterium]|nr:hypothetical protein [Verrucomicrobiaceae bacterium]
MSAIDDIESSIQTLPQQDFFTLVGWMTERHLQVLSSAEFETPELEDALLPSLDSPRHPVNNELFESIRARRLEARQ